MAKIGRKSSHSKMEYIEAAKSIGVSRMKIIFKHLVPNSLGQCVYTSLSTRCDFGGGFFDFLGLEFRAYELRELISDGWSNESWILIYPCLTLWLRF